MKQFTFFVFLFPYLLNAMDNNGYNKSNPLLTPYEAECWLWFDARIESRINALKGISTHSRAVIEKREDGDKRASYGEWIDKFFLIVGVKEQNNLAKKEYFTVALLTDTLLKMSEAIKNQSIQEPTDRPTARIYAYSKGLTAEEGKKICPAGYKNNPVEGDEVFKKLARLTVSEYVKLGLVADTLQEKEKEEKDFLEHKKLEYKLAYFD